MTKPKVIMVKPDVPWKQPKPRDCRDLSGAYQPIRYQPTPDEIAMMCDEIKREKLARLRESSPRDYRDDTRTPGFASRHDRKPVKWRGEA